VTVSSRTESAQTRELCRELEALGAITHAQVANQFSSPGWPDRYIIHPLWHGHLEFKAYNGSVTPLQAKVIRDLNARVPGSAYVVRHALVKGHGQIELIDDGLTRDILAKFENAAGLLLALYFITRTDARYEPTHLIEALRRKGAKWQIMQRGTR